MSPGDYPQPLLQLHSSVCLFIGGFDIELRGRAWLQHSAQPGGPASNPGREGEREKNYRRCPPPESSLIIPIYSCKWRGVVGAENGRARPGVPPSRVSCGGVEHTWGWQGHVHPGCQHLPCPASTIPWRPPTIKPGHLLHISCQEKCIPK